MQDLGEPEAMECISEIAAALDVIRTPLGKMPVPKLFPKSGTLERAEGGAA